MYKILFLLFSTTCFGQNSFETDTVSKIAFFADSQLEAESIAIRDIKNNNISIFIESNWASIIYPTDSVFEKKFNVKFIFQGCISSKYAVNYNYIIFNFFLKTFDKKWMKEIRKDAVGFKKWKKNKNELTILKF